MSIAILLGLQLISSLLFKYDEEFPRRMPATREAWRRSLKKSIIPKAIEMVSGFPRQPSMRRARC